jgi:threonine synthase
MQFYSTNNRSLRVNLRQAVMQGLAPDNGLYMPAHVPAFSPQFFKEISKKSFPELSFEVASPWVGDDVPSPELKKIIDHTVQFDAPLVKVDETIFALELFHGPTLAFKDFGARFLSGLLSFFSSQQDQEITILVATSGDTGSAVANGFLNVPGTQVIVLYPSGKVSDIQEKQFTTLGGNITALEVAGTFDDCQRMVKEAFLDKDLNRQRVLTSANSINIARLIPQTFYYFYASAQIKNPLAPIVFSVPSGNFGNLTAGVLAKRMGLPIGRFVAATNINDVVPEYLKTGSFVPRESKQTISNAMDVGNPSNFARLLDLYDHNLQSFATDIAGYASSDTDTKQAMRDLAAKYILDPHGAVGYLGLKSYLQEHPENTVGIFLETAHPGKFSAVVEEAIQRKLELPDRLNQFLDRKKVSIALSNRFEDFKAFLLD